MIRKEIMKYSLKNLAHRKTRSLLTILSIFIGITTIFIFVSFGWGLYDYVNDFSTGTSADKITVQTRGIGAPGLDDTFILTESDLRVVERTPGVYDATGVYMKPAEVSFRDTKKYAWLMGYDPKKPLIIELSALEIDKGRELIDGEKNKVVLGYNYQIKDKIFPDALEINNEIEIQGKDYRVIGFYKSLGNPQDDSNIYVVEDSIRELYPDSRGYGWIIARADINEIDAVVERVEENLRRHKDQEKGEEDFFVSSFKDLLESYMTALNIVVGFIILIALISVIVSAINTANTMITSVLERIKEVGIIKAIGAKNSEIFKLFLFESAFLGFVAGIIGTLLGYGITYLAGTILTNLGWGFLQPLYSPILFIGCILFATITGAISGVLPAINASKTNIVDSLRYE